MIHTMLRIRRKKLLLILILALGSYIVGCLLIPLLLKTESQNTMAVPQQKTGSERICVIDDNAGALTWRLRLIQNAKEEIILSTFDFRDDYSGQAIMAALLDAADRGVHIRIIVDGFNGQLQLGGSEHFKALISHENIEGKFYNPIRFSKLRKVNYRMHDKYLLIDSRLYLLGGRNTNDLFLGDTTKESNMDRDILVFADAPTPTSSVTALKEYFEEIWNLEDNQVLSFDPKPAQIEAAYQSLRQLWTTLLEEESCISADVDWTEETIQAESVLLLTNSCLPENKAPVLWNALCMFMEAGKESIVIQTPYVICDRNMYAGLESVCANVKDVQIVTNSVACGANPWGCSDYLNQKNRILDTGANLCEWAGNQSMHTKTILIDDQISIVGSYNLDARSTYLDTEMMLVIKCPELNQELRNQIQGMEAQSKCIASDRTENTGVDYTELNISFGKNLLYFVLRIIIQPFRHLL